MKLYGHESSFGEFRFPMSYIFGSVVRPHILFDQSVDDRFDDRTTIVVRIPLAVGVKRDRHLNDTGTEVAAKIMVAFTAVTFTNVGFFPPPSGSFFPCCNKFVSFYGVEVAVLVG